MKTYREVAAFHGHSCPGLALGYRVSLVALKEFSGRSEDEEMVAVVENNSCAVDAVQVMTGCTFGKGNLIYNDYGKQVYTFIRRPSGKSIRITIDWKKPAETKEERDLWERYRKGDRSAKVRKFVHDAKAAKTRHILEADEGELMKILRGKTALPPVADIFQSVSCEQCREMVMEPRARIRNGKVLCIPCFERKG